MAIMWALFLTLVMAWNRIFAFSTAGAQAAPLALRRRVVVVGGGPAGCTAAIYLGRALLDPLLISGYKAGGQLMLTNDIENFPGAYGDVTGPVLMERMFHQSRQFGAEIWQADCESIDFSVRPFRLRTHNCTIEADAVILASGADSLWLGAENEEEFRGRGLSTCATCDGFLYRNRSVVVVGGGDSALEEATHLARLAAHVTVIHRRGELRASKLMVQRARSYRNIDFQLNAEVVRWEGGEPTAAKPAPLRTGAASGSVFPKGRDLVGVTVHNKNTNALQTIKCDGGFIAIGHSPNSKFISSDNVQLDDDGYVVTGPSARSSFSDGLYPYSTMTSTPGVFACGDLVDKHYRQAVTAAASGCQAALDAEKWLLEHSEEEPRVTIHVCESPDGDNCPGDPAHHQLDGVLDASRRGLAKAWGMARRLAGGQWLRARRRSKD